MWNIILIVIIVVILGAATVPAVNHFKGKGGCCGGGEVKHRRKKIGKVIGTKDFLVEGMHCKHCSERVAEAVNDIPGVKAKVNLKKGIVTVSYAKQIEDYEIRNKIERAGYTVRD